MSSPQQDEKLRRRLVVDDHPIVRHGVVQLIEQTQGFEVAAQAGTAEEALTLAESGEYDLAIVDVSLQGVSGLELVKQIRERGVEMPILMMSMHDESFYAERALRAGAQGYVMKQRATAEIAEAIERVLGGDLYLSDDLSAKLLRRVVDGDPNPEAGSVSQLSDRELEVLQLLGQGVPTREVADRLNLSIKTIESYRANIKRKLELRNATELMRYAVKWVQTQGDVPKA